MVVCLSAGRAAFTVEDGLGTEPGAGPCEDSRSAYGPRRTNIPHRSCLPAKPVPSGVAVCCVATGGRARRPRPPFLPRSSGCSRRSHVTRDLLRRQPSRRRRGALLLRRRLVAHASEEGPAAPGAQELPRARCVHAARGSRAQMCSTSGRRTPRSRHMRKRRATFMLGTYVLRMRVWLPPLCPPSPVVPTRLPRLRTGVRFL